MGLAVRGNGKDKVISKSGSGWKCKKPMRTTTAQCSPNVRVNGIGAVRSGDKVKIHPKRGCRGPDTSGASGGSKVVINGKRAVKIGSKYSFDNIITSGSSNVIFGNVSVRYATNSGELYEGGRNNLNYRIKF